MASSLMVTCFGTFARATLTQSIKAQFQVLRAHGLTYVRMNA